MNPDVLPLILQQRIIIHIQPNVHLGTRCWECLCRPNRNGYRRVPASIDAREPVAHRYAWEYVNGPIPEGYILDHLCRFRACIRLDHLEPVTHRENTLRGKAILFKPRVYNQSTLNGVTLKC